VVREQVNPLEVPGAMFQLYSIPAFDQDALPTTELGKDSKER
jgi:hypothetical protein